MYLVLFSIMIGLASGFESEAMEWEFLPRQSELSFNPDLYRQFISRAENQNLFWVGSVEDKQQLASEIFGPLGIQQISPAGNLIWKREFLGLISPTGITTDLDSAVFVTFNFIGRLKLGEHTLDQPDGQSGSALIRVSADGQVEKVWSAKDLTGDSGKLALLPVSSGEIFVVNQNLRKLTLIRLDRHSNVELSISYNCVDRVSSLDVSESGDLLVAGSVSGPGKCLFGDSPIDVPNIYNQFLARYSAQGELKWVRTFEDLTASTPYARFGKSGEIFYTVSTSLAMDFGNDVTTKESDWNSIVVVAKANENAVFEWAVRLPAESVASLSTAARNPIQLDSSGDPWLLGNFGKIVEGDSSKATSRLIQDVLLIHIGPRGTVLSTTHLDALCGGELVFTDSDQFYASAIRNKRAVVLKGRRL